MRAFLFAISMLLVVASFDGDAFSFSFGNSLPNGNYQDTCNACYMIGKELACTCKTDSGMLVATTANISHHCNYVQNSNGQLECAHHHHHHRHHWGHHHHRHYRNISAGPIWNNDDANQVCPNVCADHRSTWTGQWNTTSWGSQSVCQCERH